MKFSLLLSASVIALTVTSLYAGGVPITPSQLGVQAFTATAFPNLICPSDVNGCGGAFQANIGSITGATIWCVDSQLDISQNSSYTAFVEDLAVAPHTPFNDGNFVRYGGVNTFTGGVGGWSYDLAPYLMPYSLAAAANSALIRYQLAAILITQYVPTQDMPTNSTQNQSIQDAIWRLTENNTAPTLNAPETINVGTPAGYSDWIAYAAHVLNAGTFDFSKWALVSGGFSAVDNKLEGQGYQTFLVQVTPEPRFYGVLLVGLLSLCAIIYRRRTAA